MRRRHIAQGRIVCAWIVLLLFAAGIWLLLSWLGVFDSHPLSPEEAEQKFQITRVLSTVDKNGNGVDDYTDILLGAKKDAENHPKYSAAYYAGGYPPEDEGCCADLVWRAFDHAGYTLKDMVDEDIAAHTENYPATNGTPDPNIDFRRVRNLKVFFERYAVSLSLDPTKIEEWQPGDIVTFDDPGHIGIISDLRNEKGIPYLLHNAGQKDREEDALLRYHISGHFRFDASQLEET